MVTNDEDKDINGDVAPDESDYEDEIEYNLENIVDKITVRISDGNFSTLPLIEFVII